LGRAKVGGYAVGNHVWEIAMTPAERLHRGVRAMKLGLDAEAEHRQLAYLALLEKWNRAYNLTAVRDPLVMVPRHLLDSLAVLPWLVGPRVLDVGSGAGLPGIPLAIARPDLAFTLLDSNAKKTRFITQAVAELGLANVTVANARVEDYRAPAPFATLVTRAFASIPDMLAACGHLCASGCRLLAMKGAVPQAELAALPEGFQVSAIHALEVPGLDAQRHVIIIVPR
jgi:16S rRNA (guanine527-N7)-methyltransferase